MTCRGVCGFLLLCAVLCLTAVAEKTELPVNPEVAARIAAAAPHPRLLMSDADADKLRRRIGKNETAGAVFALVRQYADSLLAEPPVTYKKEGKRLLSVSREALKRVLNLAFAHRMTGEQKYAERAMVEMDAAAAFQNWNPSHFLDTAEMTAALALGYDWLLPLLSPEREARIRAAILEKGIGPSMSGNDSWARRDNNWNQVCNGGMAFGALALLEHEPALAERVITRALDGLPYAMRTYQPDGVYVEGPSYWEYGTTYNVLLIAALESALGGDFGLADFPGFRETGAFPLLMTGPTGDHFNFSDCGRRGACFPAVFWFARRWKEPGWAWSEHQWLEKLLRGDSAAQNRFLPLLLLWWDGRSAKKPQLPLCWKGEGQNPLVVMRSSWTDPDAVFLAAKAGTPFANHGHMDAGSFVLDADGARWALDFGAEGYGALEARGLDIWNRTQKADRWRVWRYHNSSHNTLTVDGAAQKVTARADFTEFSADKKFPHAVMDLGALYGGQLARAERGFALLPDGRVLVRDEVAAPDAPARVRWVMNTPAEVAENAPGRALLAQGDKRLLFQVLEPEGAVVETWSTEPHNEWDSPNPGTRQVGFEVLVPAGAERALSVLLTPGSVLDKAPDTPPLRPLREWSGAEKKERGKVRCE